MSSMTSRIGIVWSIALTTALSACGTSGSKPFFEPEIQFQVTPLGGPTSFRVLALTTSNTVHTFPPDQEFQVNGTFSFFLENATPPWTGTFQRTGDNQIMVSLLETANTMQVKTTTADQDTVVLTLGGSRTPVGTPTAGNPEVRFDACALNVEASTCADAANVPGALLFGRGLNGSVGDPFVTRLMTGTAPAILFVEGVQETAMGVFTPIGSYSVHAQLYVNGVVADSQFGTGNVILTANL
jgi:hypothetical protein